MVGEPVMSDPVDPLHAFSGISIFTRTFRDSTNVAVPSDPKELDSIHQLMKSLKMSSPERILDEAKAIVDGGSELLNSQFSKFADYMGIDKDAIGPEGKEKPQERRPGLGRKRAHFSLKPNTSQPTVTLEQSLDIDQLQDPAEFFSAYEKLENAQREIRKQKGGTASDVNESLASAITRHRRPGILGKSATYKHRYSSMHLESDDILTSSQETQEPVVLSAAGHEIQDPEVADVETEEIDVVGSITNTENKVNDILDELLAKDGKDLDDDGALSLLQERLQIKPIDLGNVSIPEFRGIGKTNFMALGERLPKARKSGPNTSNSNVVMQLQGETPKTQKEAVENLTNPIASPTPPRSPFAQLSLLKMYSLQSNQSRDPFTSLNFDLLEPRNPFSVEDIDKQADEVDVLKEPSMSGKSRSELEDETNRPSGSDMDIHTMEPRGSESFTNDSLDKNLEGQIRDTEITPNGSKMDLQDNLSGREIHGKNVDCDRTKGTKASDLTNGPEPAENIADTSKVALASQETNLDVNNSVNHGSSSSVHISQFSQDEVIPSKAAVPAEQDVNIQNPTSSENMDGFTTLSDRLTSTPSREHAADVPSTAVKTNSVKDTEKYPSKKQQGKGKRPRGASRESKTIVLRPSLAAAGTSFETGVRRSKRIKTRPLEYWKGERLLYGRIGTSLKLVGIKYASPSKGDGNLTVKSYVPDEYKEIVQLAAHY